MLLAEALSVTHLPVRHIEREQEYCPDGQCNAEYDHCFREPGLIAILRVAVDDEQIQAYTQSQDGNDLQQQQSAIMGRLDTYAEPLCLPALQVTCQCIPLSAGTQSRLSHRSSKHWDWLEFPCSGGHAEARECCRREVCTQCKSTIALPCEPVLTAVTMMRNQLKPANTIVPSCTLRCWGSLTKCYLHGRYCSIRHCAGQSNIGRCSIMAVSCNQLLAPCCARQYAACQLCTPQK